MDPNEERLKWAKAFCNREIRRFSVYVEGFGEIFIRRVKDGMVIGYRDKNKHFGINDHFTIFFDMHGVTDIHRTVGDASNVVYMKYNIDYFSSPDGIGKLLRDTQKQRGISFATKMLFVIVYKQFNRVFEEGLHVKSFRVLSDLEAQRLGTKSPCVYVKAGYAEQILFLPLYKIIIQLVSGIFMHRFGKRPSEGFMEQKYMGTHITKHQERKEKQ
jgi:hypothetical protein